MNLKLVLEEIILQNITADMTEKYHMMQAMGFKKTRFDLISIGYSYRRMTLMISIFERITKKTEYYEKIPGFKYLETIECSSE